MATKPSKPISSDDIRDLLRPLVWVCAQFFEGKDEHGTLLWHQLLSAGEETFERLEEYGLIETRAEGGGWKWTATGQALRDE